MAKKDYYAILGIPRDADDNAIKKAYRKLAMQYHPDRNPGKEGWANEKFKDINEAFSVLGDPEKRRQYDQFGTAGNVGDIFSSPYTQTTFEDLMRDFGTSGLGTGFLDEVFGDLLRGKGFSFKVYRTNSGTPQGFNFSELFRQAQAPPPHREVSYKMAISKEQAARGVEKDFKRGKKKLRVKIPTGIKDGMTVRLSNALQTTDGQPGDIMIHVKVK